jgi:MYXO-CTERM domain-containing protein
VGLRQIKGVTVVAALLLGSQSTPAHAYGQTTHRWIARQAVELLVARYPGQYDELLEFEDRIADGAEHEDDFIEDGDGDPTTMRVMRHFYRPTDGLGILYGDFDRFPSSYEWGGVANDTNQWDYADGLVAFSRGDHAEAYFIVGHTMHLIADLSVPAHSHLVEHGPPTGNDLESYCSSLMTSEFASALQGVAPGAPLPNFTDLEDAFQSTAWASYWRNMVPGVLEDEEAGGVLAEMFPTIEQNWFNGSWTIPGIGSLGSGFYEVEGEPGFFYFKKNQAVSALRRTEFNPVAPTDHSYGQNQSGDTLTKQMADDLVPVAILHSAAVLKLFVDQARSRPVDDDEGASLTPQNQDLPGGCQTAASSGLPTLVLLLGLFARMRRRHQ